ncbi:hypothetical protein BvCmsOUP088_01717 [Escherichia coli]|nr:hypothetical protein BvCmsOUP088_01717 [Escherichia coli]
MASAMFFAVTSLSSSPLFTVIFPLPPFTGNVAVSAEISSLSPATRVFIGPLPAISTSSPRLFVSVLPSPPLILIASFLMLSCSVVPSIVIPLSSTVTAISPLPVTVTSLPIAPLFLLLTSFSFPVLSFNFHVGLIASRSSFSVFAIAYNWLPLMASVLVSEIAPAPTLTI